MDTKHIKIDIADQILTITLDRPKALNAFTFTMLREMLGAFDLADADDDVRAVIVTGAGRAFCAGADLSMGSGTFDYDAHADDGTGDGAAASAPRASGEVEDTGGILALRIFNSTKPVIGAINGHAVGVGASMTLPMDIRLAADTAKIGFVFAARGITPEACSTWFLPRVVGISQAAEWIYTARLFPASEGLAAGLIRSVHPADDVVGAARATWPRRSPRTRRPSRWR